MLKKIFLFLIILCFLTSCTSTVPFIKKTIVYTQLPTDFYSEVLHYE